MRKDLECMTPQDRREAAGEAFDEAVELHKTKVRHWVRITLLSALGAAGFALDLKTIEKNEIPLPLKSGVLLSAFYMFCKRVETEGKIAKETALLAEEFFQVEFDRAARPTQDELRYLSSKYGWSLRPAEVTDMWGPEQQQDLLFMEQFLQHRPW